MKKRFLIFILIFSFFSINNSYAENTILNFTWPKTVFEWDKFQVKWETKWFKDCYTFWNHIKISEWKYWTDILRTWTNWVYTLTAKHKNFSKINSMNLWISCDDTNGYKTSKQLKIKVLENSLNACTKEYIPVCWIYNWERTTFWNKCEMERKNSKFLFKWKCEDFYKNIKTSIKPISWEIIIWNSWVNIKLKVLNDEYNNPYSKEKNSYRILNQWGHIWWISSNINQTNFNLICQWSTKKMKLFLFPPKNINPWKYWDFVWWLSRKISDEWVKQFKWKTKVNCYIEWTFNNNLIDVENSVCKPKPIAENWCEMKKVWTNSVNCNIYQKICKVNNIKLYWLYSLSFAHPSWAINSNSNKVSLIKFDLIDWKIKNKKVIKNLWTFKSDLYKMDYSYINSPKKCYNSKFIWTKYEWLKDQHWMYISSSLQELTNKLRSWKSWKYPANYSGSLCNNWNFWTVFTPNNKLIEEINKPDIKEEKDENIKFINYIYKEVLWRMPSLTEINYYQNKKIFWSKKYSENQIQNSIIKDILKDAANWELFVSQDNVLTQNISKEQFIKNLYKFWLKRQITSYELQNWKKFLEKYNNTYKEEIFDYFFESKEFEKFMKYSNYSFSYYSNDYTWKVKEFWSLNTKFYSLLPLTIKRECAYSLVALSDWKWDKMCVKIGDWKCSTNENKYNSVDCKVWCKNYDVPSWTKKIYNSKNCVIWYDKIETINTQKWAYECMEYPVYSYNFETKKQVNHFLPNSFNVKNCKYTWIREYWEETVYIPKNSNKSCISGLAKVKVKWTDNFSKCVKIDNYCSEKEKDTYSVDCKKKKENGIEVTNELKDKIDSIIKKFILKMDKYNYTNKQKIAKLKSIISKINILILTHKKYENLFKYLNKKLEEEVIFLLIWM